ncbi:hypothetical protein KCTCHS21_50630 [Cohnella abietis]|uniref:Uncharacterized protein n=1 Tax=Cohnella abietis TaxID=2507935 RepID=A0A3T1DCA0_9BACL|nr:hypothetical protein KCTCHS21_50630 [Cohnella abietis]
MLSSPLTETASVTVAIMLIIMQKTIMSKENPIMYEYKIHNRNVVINIDKEPARVFTCFPIRYSPNLNLLPTSAAAASPKDNAKTANPAKYSFLNIKY